MPGIILLILFLFQELSVLEVLCSQIYQNETIAYCSLQSILFNEKYLLNLTELCSTNNSILCYFQEFNEAYCEIHNTETDNVPTILTLSGAIGTIPTQLGLLRNLKQFIISDSSLTGTIPTQIGSLVNLTYFKVYNNLLSGTIPTHLGNLVNLFYFDVSSNLLTGTIPSQLGKWTKSNRNLSLLICDNFFSGTIPTQLGSIKSLGLFYAFNNSLSGTIPTQLGNWTQCTFFQIQDNSLSGTIPTQLGNLHKLLAFNFSNNPLSGTIPQELGAWGVSAFDIYISGTDLCGDVPYLWKQKSWQFCIINIPHSCDTVFPMGCTTTPCDDLVECIDNCETGTHQCENGRDCRRISKFRGYTCTDCVSPYTNDGPFKCNPIFLSWLLPILVLSIIISVAIYIYKRKRDQENIPLVTLEK